MKRTILWAIAALMLGGPAYAQQSPIRIGFISTMSGPAGVLGQDLADGFKLGLQHSDNKLGGRAIKMFWGDDEAKPDIGRQVADRMLESDHVQILTGINFSNVLLAVVKPTMDAGAFYISVNAGPSELAGKQCNKNFFSASFQNDQLYEALGILMNKKGVKSAYFIAPNYPAGKDMGNGFQRKFHGKIVGQSFPAFGQLDYSAEIAQIRAAKPAAVVFFLPGGMGINFVKQYAQAGLKSQIPLYAGAQALGQTELPGIGDAALGIDAAVLWSEFLDNPQSKEFAADFEKTYHRIPSGYAATAYDTVLLLNAALKSINGKIEDKKAFRKAMETVKFNSIRGHFKFNTNHFPIIDFYNSVIEKDAKGRLVNALKGVIVRGLADSYASQCKMASD